MIGENFCGEDYSSASEKELCDEKDQKTNQHYANVVAWEMNLIRKILSCK